MPVQPSYKDLSSSAVGVQMILLAVFFLFFFDHVVYYHQLNLASGNSSASSGRLPRKEHIGQLFITTQGPRYNDFFLYGGLT